MSPARIAVIGYGRWGRYCHAPLIRLAEGLELAGVASGSAEKREQIQRELGCRAYRDLDEALADESVDAVVLATPNDTHAQYAVRALEAGKHVVTDKIMCLSLEECDRMIGAAQTSGTLLTVFQNRRLDGDFLTLKRLLAEGELGDLRWLEMAWHGFGAWGGWRGQADRGGGKLFDLGAHLVDQMLLLFPGPVSGVYCRLHHDFPESSVESEAFLVLEWENGATSIADMSSLSLIPKPRFYARGTKATWQKYGLDPQEAALMAGDITTAREDPATYGKLAVKGEERVVPTLAGDWRGFYPNFARAVAGMEAPLVKLDEARRVMAVFEAARQSVRAGQVVRVGI